MTTKRFDKSAHERRRSLRFSTGEGAFMAASSTITDTYTTPYALAVGANNFEVGLLNSLKSLAHIASQLPGAALSAGVSRKRICLLSIAISKLLWLPIILLPMFLGNAVLILLALVTLSVFVQSLRSPAWTGLMGDLVHEEERGRYFSSRNAITALTGLIATLGAGFAVAALGFPLIFAASIMLGLAAFFMFRQMHEPAFTRIFHYRPELTTSLRQSVSTLRTYKNFSRFTSYMLFLNFATDISGPFIVVYILKDLAISYEMFAVVVAIGMVSRIISQRYWGYFTDKYGSRAMLSVFAVLLCFIPVAYLLSSNLGTIIVARVYDGIIWGGIDLAAFTFLLDVTPASSRPQFAATHNMLVGIGAMAGAFLGGLLAQSYSIGGTLSAIQFLFLLSFLLRLATLLVLRTVKDTARTSTRHDRVMLSPLTTEAQKGMHHAAAFAKHSTIQLRTFGENVDEALRGSRARYEHEQATRRRKRSYYEPPDDET